MIYLTLFLVFLEIGEVSFGGGYGMIPMMRDAGTAVRRSTTKPCLTRREGRYPLCGHSIPRFWATSTRMISSMLLTRQKCSTSQLR